MQAPQADGRVPLNRLTKNSDEAPGGVGLAHTTLLPLYSNIRTSWRLLFLSRGLCSNPLVVERVQVENDLLLMAQEPKA